MSRQLTESDRASVQRSIDLIDRLGDLVGGWGRTTTQCRQKGFTATFTFDNKVSPFEAEEFAAMMEQAPAILGPYLRRILEIDDELKEVLDFRPLSAQEMDEIRRVAD